MTKNDMKRLIYAIVLFMAILPGSARADSFNIEMVEDWGRFPKFCVKMYKLGNSLFNSYDTAYVVTHGMPFTIRPSIDLWGDTYDFKFPDNTKLNCVTTPFMSVGIKAQFMALSYTYNISINGKNRPGRQKNWSVGFSCSRFDLSLSIHNNEVGTRITNYTICGDQMFKNVMFPGLTNYVLAVEGLYIFNNRKYSRLAAFAMSKIQKKSSGSFFAGFKYDHHKATVDMGTRVGVPMDSLVQKLRFDNYHLSGGYGYNFVLGKGWIIGVQDIVSLGLTRGQSQGYEKSSKFGFQNRFSVAVGWNRPRWFVNLQGCWNVCRYSESDFGMYEGYYTASLAVGYRFKLW